MSQENGPRGRPGQGDLSEVVPASLPGQNQKGPAPDWEERQRKVLAHIGLYRLSVRFVLARLFFDGNEKACDNVITRLRSQGKIEGKKGLPGGLSYYCLSEEEALRQNFPATRGGLPAASEVSGLISELWFFCMSAKKRIKLDAADLERIPASKGTTRTHCLEEGGPPPIYRLYIPSRTAPMDEVLRPVREDLRSLKANPTQADWLLTRNYRIAILPQNNARREAIEEAVDRAKLREFTEILVEVAPGDEELKEAVKCST